MDEADKARDIMKEMGATEDGMARWVKDYIRMTNCTLVEAEAEWIIFLESIKNYRIEKSEN